jgi:hypothetical protein
VSSARPFGLANPSTRNANYILRHDCACPYR